MPTRLQCGVDLAIHRDRIRQNQVFLVDVVLKT
jgi:hypothetical protein